MPATASSVKLRISSVAAELRCSSQAALRLRDGVLKSQSEFVAGTTVVPNSNLRGCKRKRASEQEERRETSCESSRARVVALYDPDVDGGPDIA
jgi:hypothetical protein